MTRSPLQAILDAPNNAVRVGPSLEQMRQDCSRESGQRGTLGAIQVNTVSAAVHDVQRRRY
jgi:hypothetical protein